MWKDNFEFPYFDIVFSGRYKCGVDVVSDVNNDKTIIVIPGLAATDFAPNVAEVYPNPSTNSFKPYLSLNYTHTSNIGLLSIDGKKLQSKTVRQNKGVVDIDTSSYKPGVYIINIKQGNYNKTIKVIKE